MRGIFQFGSRRFQADLSKPISIGMRQSFAPDQVNHFGVALAAKQPIRADGFIGATRLGGSCNVDQISIIPHCNGTHVEHVGHIVDDEVGPALTRVPPFMLAALVSVEPTPAGAAASESYRPPLEPQNRVIGMHDLRQAASKLATANWPLQALVVRTLPNDSSKLHRRYGPDCEPPFFTGEAVEWIVAQGFSHLLVDFPSLDRMHDDGLLTNHHLFWNVAERTHQLAASSHTARSVTELVYVPNEVRDGLYLLNLQFPDWATDAAPARPLLFAMEEYDSQS